MLRRHTVHRILDILERTGTCCDVEQWEICHARLVLAVEGELCGVGREENTTRDAKLVAAYGLTIDNIFILLGCYGNLLLAIEEVEVVLACISVEITLATLACEVLSYGDLCC